MFEKRFMGKVLQDILGILFLAFLAGGAWFLTICLAAVCESY